MERAFLGNEGEKEAISFLKKKKYKILERNYQTKLGEIDIVARDKDYIVFVEVKTRTSYAFGDPLEAVDLRKQKKLRILATLYLQQKRITNSYVRFDVLGIMEQNGEKKIEHIMDAF